MPRVFIPLSLLLFSAALLSKVVALFLADTALIPMTSHQWWQALLWGTRLDFVMVTLSVVIVLLVHLATGGYKPLRWLPKLVAAIAAVWIIMTTAADAIYTMQTGTHITFEVFTAEDSEFALLITALQTSPLLVIAASILSVMSIIGASKLPFQPLTLSGKRLISSGFFSVILLAATVTVVRGGWSDAPQSPMSAHKIGNAEQAFIAWSAPYSITYHLAKGAKNAAQQITPRITLDYDKQPLLQAQLANLKQANIVFVLLESWASVDMQSYAGQVDATPFFDQLRAQSLSAHAMYANGFRTVQGIFASHCSFPNPVSSSVAGTQLQTKAYSCLPQLLREQGWQTHFIQGSGKGSVGQFAQSLGYQFSYGKTDYDFSAEQNYWGYMDDGIYRFSLDKISTLEQQDQPWLVTINTGTTHDTYLPDESLYVFGKDNSDQVRRSVLHHADGALERFITQLNQTVKRPTLVVLMSDHTALGSSHDLSANSIPFLIYATDGSIAANTLDISTSQRDITPTIFDWLGGEVPWFSGFSLLKPNKHQGGAQFVQGESIRWIEQDNLIRFNARTGALEQCSKVADDTITLLAHPCDDEFQSLWKQAKTFTFISQQLLFDGQTQYYSNQRMHALP
ncbi:LTA synthase family protein [Vibrio metschnikovii]|uniref:LTA synthase family protein n=1 Tax=bacterium 19PA01SH03 TaxID=2920705 RepID=A0AAU6SN56_UNCXX|nr:LTA synthase family protein [Vibrio metschnikovii]EKO3576261.1 LTA synthase family protein [Vibrio metschnikovii]EKO3586401.1 LTA synthase family protein [Vibrio metschnikovii]EKO3604069.1 LTA synthase family protein [Vibrio metschnikovii]EKO3614739.1 LTA synthase family protein [Vibrio metschnikovii]